MTNSSLREDYFHWLEPQIRSDYEAQRPCGDLLRLMFEKEFGQEYLELVPNDYNRAMDGLDLRLKFCRERRIRPNSLNRLGPASFLEVLIGL
ncbi:MAG TPA: hypothetical protein VN843_21695, partial [Anaerolineales bacterium]|nr:hypothetical protein [Anaerolineales bacterium]